MVQRSQSTACMEPGASTLSPLGKQKGIRASMLILALRALSRRRLATLGPSNLGRELRLFRRRHSRESLPMIQAVPPGRVTTTTSQSPLLPLHPTHNFQLYLRGYRVSLVHRIHRTVWRRALCKRNIIKWQLICITGLPTQLFSLHLHHVGLAASFDGDASYCPRVMALHSE